MPEADELEKTLDGRPSFDIEERGAFCKLGSGDCDGVTSKGESDGVGGEK